MSDSGPLSAVVAGGRRLVSLRALRDRLAAEIDRTDSARDVAALSQRVMDVLEQIDAIEKAQPAQKGTPLDELKARRAGKAPSPRQPRSSRNAQ